MANSSIAAGIAAQIRDMALKGEAPDAATLRMVANELDRQQAVIARFVAISNAMNALQGAGAEIAHKEAA